MDSKQIETFSWKLKKDGKDSRNAAAFLVRSSPFVIALDDGNISNWTMKLYKTIPTGSYEGFTIKLTCKTVSNLLNIQCRASFTHNKNGLSRTNLSSPYSFQKDTSGQAYVFKIIYRTASPFVPVGLIRTVNCEITITYRKTRLDETKMLNEVSVLNYKKLFEEEVLTDFKLKTNDNKIINAHKVILAARSTVFSAMLQSDMEESNTGEVNISDFDSTTMKELLRFIYCNEVENLTDIAEDLIFAAEKYQIKELKNICRQSLIKSLTVENVIKALKVTDLITNTEVLFDACVKLISENKETIVKQQEWNNLPMRLLKMIQNRLLNR